jgi:hypothetical protein
LAHHWRRFLLAAHVAQQPLVNPEKSALTFSTASDDFGTRNPPNLASLNQQLADHAAEGFSEHGPKRAFGAREGSLSAHFSLSYSALACLRMGMSGSASFQRVRQKLVSCFGSGVVSPLHN